MSTLNGVLSIKANATTDTIVSLCGDSVFAGLTVSQISESGLTASSNNSFGNPFDFKGEPDGFNITFQDALNSYYSGTFNNGTSNYTVFCTPCLIGISLNVYYPVCQ